MKRIGFLLAVCTFLFCGATYAQTTKEFVHKAAMAGMKEVKAGEMAQRKGVNPRVKAFGARMVDDHSRVNAELMNIAKNKGMAAELPAPGSVMADPMLVKATGAQFDRMYVTMMVSDHKEAVALFENTARNDADPDIRKFAKSVLPKLRQHLESIKSIDADMHLKGLVW